MAGRNVITREALRPNGRPQTLTMVLLDSLNIKLRSGERRWRAEFHRPLVSERRDRL
jgi:hypothetical protein